MHMHIKIPCFCYKDFYLKNNKKKTKTKTKQKRGGGGQAAQGWGIPPGYLHSGGETRCTKAASLTVGGGGGGQKGGRGQATQDSG